CKFLSTSVRSAEMMKYSCNNFHALKITFANETARLCDALGVDAFEVMDLMCQDTHLNISRAYLKPGFAFGGSCLPKDLRATTYLAKIHDVEIPMLAGIMPSNRDHLDLALQKLLATGKRKIGFVGLSFKTGTDDLRESPLVSLAEQLIGKGMQLSIYDPEVRLAQLLGANRIFIEKHLPHIGKMLRADMEGVIEESEVLVVGLADRTVFDTLASRCRPDQVVLDLVNVPNRAAIRAKVEGLCW
ncbi:MAG: UDP-glucose/GDP-mannose dehydrogenase family protein, partial [Rhodoferax sp.]|uniref:UDP binding domain-containing protein n=1 Tax=Rhodoferax sp. TaxID=50421 RepID=UPI0013FEEF61